MKNHVFEVFTAHVVDNPNSQQIEKHAMFKSENIDFKTGLTELDKIKIYITKIIYIFFFCFVLCG